MTFGAGPTAIKLDITGEDRFSPVAQAVVAQLREMAAAGDKWAADQVAAYERVDKAAKQHVDTQRTVQSGIKETASVFDQLLGKVEQSVTSFGSLNTGLTGFATSLGPLQLGLAGAAGALTAFVAESVKLGAQVEHLQGQMRALVTSATGSVAGFDEMKAHIEGLRATLFALGEDDDKAMQLVRNSFVRSSGDMRQSLQILDESVKIASTGLVDMSQAMDILDRAMTGNYRGLRELGIGLNEYEKATLDAMDADARRAAILQLVDDHTLSLNTHLNDATTKTNTLTREIEDQQKQLGLALQGPYKDFLDWLLTVERRADATAQAMQRFTASLPKLPDWLVEAGKAAGGIAGFATGGLLSPFPLPGPLQDFLDRMQTERRIAEGQTQQPYLPEFGGGINPPFAAPGGAAAGGAGGGRQPSALEQVGREAKELQDSIKDVRDARRDAYTAELEQIRTQRDTALDAEKTRTTGLLDGLKERQRAGQTAFEEERRQEDDRHTRREKEIRDNEAADLASIRRRRDAARTAATEAIGLAEAIKTAELTRIQGAEDAYRESMDRRRRAEQDDYDQRKQALADEVRERDKTDADTLRAIDRELQANRDAREAQKQQIVDTLKARLQAEEDAKNAIIAASKAVEEEAQRAHTAELRRIEDTTRAGKAALQERLDAIKAETTAADDAARAEQLSYQTGQAQQGLAAARQTGDPEKVKQAARRVYEAEQAEAKAFRDQQAKLQEDLLQSVQKGLDQAATDQRRTADDELQRVRDTEKGKQDAASATYEERRRLLNAQITDEERAAAAQIKQWQDAAQSRKDQIGVELDAFHEQKRLEGIALDADHKYRLGLLDTEQKAVEKAYGDQRAEATKTADHAKTQAGIKRDEVLGALTAEEDRVKGRYQTERDEEGATHTQVTTNIADRQSAFNTMMDNERTRITRESEEKRAAIEAAYGDKPGGATYVAKQLNTEASKALDALAKQGEAVKAAFDPTNPQKTLDALGQLQQKLQELRPLEGPPLPVGYVPATPTPGGAAPGTTASLGGTGAGGVTGGPLPVGAQMATQAQLEAGLAAYRARGSPQGALGGVNAAWAGPGIAVNQGPSVTRDYVIGQAQARGLPAAAGAAVYDLGVKYNVDPNFALAVMATEGSSTTNLFSVGSYPGGAEYGQIPGTGRFPRYQSYNQAIDDFYRQISTFYYGQGQTNTYSIYWGVGGSPGTMGMHAYGPANDNPPSAEYNVRAAMQRAAAAGAPPAPAPVPAAPAWDYPPGMGPGSFDERVRPLSPWELDAEIGPAAGGGGGGRDTDLFGHPMGAPGLRSAATGAAGAVAGVGGAANAMPVYVVNWPAGGWGGGGGLAGGYGAAAGGASRPLSPAELTGLLAQDPQRRLAALDATLYGGGPSGLAGARGMPLLAPGGGYSAAAARDPRDPTATIYTVPNASPAAAMAAQYPGITAGQFGLDPYHVQDPRFLEWVRSYNEWGQTLVTLQQRLAVSTDTQREGIEKSIKAGEAERLHILALIDSFKHAKSAVDEYAQSQATAAQISGALDRLLPGAGRGGPPGTGGYGPGYVGAAEDWRSMFSRLMAGGTAGHQTLWGYLRLPGAVQEDVLQQVVSSAFANPGTPFAAANAMGTLLRQQAYVASGAMTWGSGGVGDPGSSPFALAGEHALSGVEVIGAAQSGTYATRTGLYLLAEREPEYVIPQSQMSRLTSSARGVNVTVHMTVNAGDMGTVSNAQILGDKINRDLGRQLSNLIRSGGVGTAISGLTIR